MNELSKRIVEIIKSVPHGKVLTYGGVAALAGAPRGARQVSWLLKTQTKKHSLPWWRVINSKGKISIKDPVGYQLQKNYLEEEGIRFTTCDEVELNKYLWRGY